MTIQRSKRTGWLWLMLASLFEITFALSTNASQGFTLLGPSILTIVTAGAGLFLLAKALKYLDVSIGYTVWVGIGPVGTVILGTALFSEPMSLIKLLCFALILGGIIGLKLVDKIDSPEAAS